MQIVKQTLVNFAKDESGQDLIEYALVAALIGLGAVTALGGVKTAIVSAFNSIAAQLGAAV